MRRTPEGDDFISCLRCGKDILDVCFAVIGGQRVYTNVKALDECETPCIGKTTHLAPDEKHLLLPKTARDQTVIDIRLESPKS